jgi:hypothetical protein
LILSRNPRLVDDVMIFFPFLPFVAAALQYVASRT